MHSIKSSFLRLTVLLFIVSLLFGFRIKQDKEGNSQRWAVTAIAPTLWVQLNDSDINFRDTELPDDDPLYNGGTDLNSMLLSIFSDINSVATSFIRLANYPEDPDNPEEGDSKDIPFSMEEAEIRTIVIEFTDENDYNNIETNNSFCANIEHESYYYGYCKKPWTKSCKIFLNKDDFEESLQSSIRVLTHEILHCLGFAHNHDTHKSIMSYIYDEQILRLQMDDKIGLTYLYPSDPKYNDEEVTFGILGCE